MVVDRARAVELGGVEVVNAEFDGAVQNLDGVCGVAVFQLHGTEADSQDVVTAQLSVRVCMWCGHGRSPPDMMTVSGIDSVWHNPTLAEAESIPLVR
jgi:hypothetical protein